MKKVASLLTVCAGYLTLATTALAEAITISVAPPRDQLGNPIGVTTDINTVFQNAIRIIFVIAAILVLVYLIWGAFQWITSGGDKEAVDKARKRITHAIIGLFILALAFLIITVVGQIVGINIVGNLTIPTLNSPLVTPAPIR